MKPEIAKLWTAALRSGEYKQAKGVLFDGQGYCCLGVLCAIVGEKFEPSQVSIISGVNKKEVRLYVVEGTKEAQVLPWTVKEECAMNSENGRFPLRVQNLISQKIPNCPSELSTLNDDGATFNQIADIIDDYWSDL